MAKEKPDWCDRCEQTIKPDTYHQWPDDEKAPCVILKWDEEGEWR